MNGIVVGGWEFVWAAYALTAIALLAYGVMVVTRSREERRRAEAAPDRG
jgi:heme exporter protein D